MGSSGTGTQGMGSGMQSQSMQPQSMMAPSTSCNNGQMNQGGFNQSFNPQGPQWSNQNYSQAQAQGSQWPDMLSQQAPGTQGIGGVGQVGMPMLGGNTSVTPSMSTLNYSPLPSPSTSPSMGGAEQMGMQALGGGSMGSTPGPLNTGASKPGGNQSGAFGG